MSFNLSLASAAQSLLHALGQKNKIVFIYRTALACLTDAHEDLLTAKWLGRTASLNNVKEGDLLGGEALATLRTFPTTADLSALFYRTRVDHARVIVAAKWADHPACPFSK
jgi:hypothetical protein